MRAAPIIALLMWAAGGRAFGFEACYSGYLEAPSPPVPPSEPACIQYEIDCSIPFEVDAYIEDLEDYQDKIKDYHSRVLEIARRQDALIACSIGVYEERVERLRRVANRRR